MESDRFDELVRTFGQTRSRRQTLRGLAGVAAGAVAVGAGAARAAPRLKPLGRACKNSDQCLSGICTVNHGKGPANTCQTCIAFGDPCVIEGEATCCQTSTFVFACIDTVIGRICTGIRPR
jgi:hypothetical protein